MSTSPIGSFLRSLTTPEILFPNLTAAVLIAVMNITLATSMGALVFSGDLAEHLSSGVALMLVGTAVGGVLIAALSGFKAVVSAPRSGLAPVFATMAAAVAISVGDQPGNVVMPTVVAAILGWVILAEALGPLQAAGCVIILAGVWLAQRYGMSQRKRA